MLCGRHAALWNTDLKTLVLGGYGNFGARICRALASDTAVQLVVGGRNAEPAQALAATLGSGAQGLAVDHTAPGFAQWLRDQGIGLVLHTAGPFQQQAYAVAHAAAAAQAHYIDLADGRRFVCDFPEALHAAFTAAGRTAISGASTVPALSSAVVEHLTAGWQGIDTIDTCIAPAQTAPRGRATLAGVLSYCGVPIPVWTGGCWQMQRGWAQPVPVHFEHMRTRRGALCDIPDLELFPAHYGVSERVMFRAAMEVGLVQSGFAVLAACHAAGLLPRPQVLAGLLHHAGQAFDFMGSSLGGMVLRASGTNTHGQTVRRAWHIAADDDHGPEIPCMAALLLARKLARGEALPSGAYTSLGQLTLAEFEPEFAHWGMVTATIEERSEHGRPAP